MSFYEKIEEGVLKDQNIEVLKTISYEAKIKISKQDIEKIEGRLRELGFQEMEERIEKDVVVFSQGSNSLKLKKELGKNKEELLLIFNKKISSETKQSFIIKFSGQNVYEWTFEKLLETVERETTLPKGIKEILNLTLANKNNIHTDKLQQVKIVKVEKRRIVFYDSTKMRSVSFDLGVIKKEMGRTIHLGDFIELSANSKEELAFLIQQFKDLGQVSFLHYYEMKNEFSQNIRD
jgi:hypothetical protein